MWIVILHLIDHFSQTYNAHKNLALPFSNHQEKLVCSKLSNEKGRLSFWCGVYVWKFWDLRICSLELNSFGVRISYMHFTYETDLKLLSCWLSCSDTSHLVIRVYKFLIFKKVHRALLLIIFVTIVNTVSSWKWTRVLLIQSFHTLEMVPCMTISWITISIISCNKTTSWIIYLQNEIALEQITHHLILGMVLHSGGLNRKKKTLIKTGMDPDFSCASPLTGENCFCW